MKFKIYPYNMHSQSAKKLAHALGVLRVYPDRNCYVKPDNVFINWGNSTYPDWWFAERNGITWINKPVNISIAANKRKTFDSFLFSGVPHPDWTDCEERAQAWIDDGHKVYGRKSLTGHSGQGIYIFDQETICSSMECLLYVKAVKKNKEYRVHVASENIIDFQQKKKKEAFEGGIPGIRNHSNGWVYSRQGIELPEKIKEQSIRAVQALGLDFGAVDVCTSLDGNVYVFEVNTAPGLEGTTLDKYVNYFRRL